MGLFFKNKKYNQEQLLAHNQQSAPADVAKPVAKKKPRSEKQLEASRRNGRRSHGPRNTERTRYNAIKHALRAQGLTPWDDVDEYRETLCALMDIYRPSNPIDRLLAQQSAQEMVRMHRSDRLEAENITAMSSSPDSSSDGIPTIHFMAMKEYGGPVFDTLNRYRTASMNRLLRYKRELERIPRDNEPAQEDTKGDEQDDSIDLAAAEPSSKLPS